MQSDLQPGWQCLELGDLVTFRSGGTPSRSVAAFWNGHIPWISAKDMKVLDLDESIEKLTEDGAKAATVVPASTLLVLVRGMGLFKDFPVGITSRPTAFNQDVKALIPRRDYCHRFLAYALIALRRAIMARVDSAGHGTGRLSIEHLIAQPVLIPPMGEQALIVELLDAWGQSIRKMECLIAAKQRQRTWMCTQLLTGRVRLSGFSAPWSDVSLSIVLRKHGLRSRGGEPVFSVSVHKGLVNQVEHLGRSFAALNTGNYSRVLPGDIVYTKSPTGDFPLGIIKQSRGHADVLVSPLYGVFTPISRNVGVILDAYFESPIATSNYLSPLVQKGAKNTIAVADGRFLEGTLRLPTDAVEIDALAQLMERTRAELQALEKQLDLLRVQKCGLLQKLISGEWRLADSGAEAA